MQPTPVFLPGESHEQRSLAGYSPWGHKESDMTEATEHEHETSLLETAQQFLKKRSDFIFQQQCMRGLLALRSQQT